jgi:uncharacterized membrane-anchored protein YhcB (DUF1043 family)
MSLDAAYLGANIAMILGILVVAMLLTFVGTYLMTRARHPAQERTLSELERTRTELDVMRRKLDEQIAINAELRSAFHQIQMVDWRLANLKRSELELLAKREAISRDAQGLQLAEAPEEQAAEG